MIQLARFGDLIQTKRLISTLSARPGSEVHLCVDVSLAALAALVYPRAVLHPVVAHGTGLSRQAGTTAILTKNRQIFQTIRDLDFSEVYNLNFSPLNFRIASLFSDEQVQGYKWRNGQELIGIWPSMAMRWSNSRRTGINLVDFWAGYCPDMIPGQSINPAATPSGGGIGIVLAGRESRRSLLPALLARFATALCRKNKSTRLQLIGSKSEQKAGEMLLKHLPGDIAGKTENLAGKTDWASLVEIVSDLDMLVTPDTGTMHLAAHLGTPVRAFFLSSAWCFETGPYGEGHLIYQSLYPCTPCLESAECPHNVQCRTPFEDPKFDRFLLTGKPDHVPEGLMSLSPEFDELGITYRAVAGADPDAESRKNVRAFLTDYLLGKSKISPDSDRIYAEILYRDRESIIEHTLEQTCHTLT